MTKKEEDKIAVKPNSANKYVRRPITTLYFWKFPLCVVKLRYRHRISTWLGPSDGTHYGRKLSEWQIWLRCKCAGDAEVSAMYRASITLEDRRDNWCHVCAQKVNNACLGAL